MFVAIVTRLRGLLQRRRVAREVDDELRFHLEMETDANVKRGLPEGEARRMALLDLGGLTRTKEAIRDVRSVSLESIWQDARFALRGMRKRLGFTTLVVTTLAAGIGVNAASLAVAYGILGRPLPYADAPRIVILNLLFFDGGDLGFSPKALHEWLSRLHTVEVAAGYRKREVTVRAGARSTVVPAAFVTERFFDVLGTPAEVGRARPRVDSPELIVSRRALDRVFGGSTASESVGTLVSVSDQGYVVSGVMPSEFSFPDDEIALWPNSIADTWRDVSVCRVFKDHRSSEAWRDAAADA